MDTGFALQLRSAADAKTQLEALNTQYVALHNKQDAAGMAAMFTADCLNTVAGGTRKMDQLPPMFQETRSW